MANPFRGDDFARVADFLVDDPANIVAEATEWNRLESARARSAVSRGYYSVFLLLKQRLRAARADWRNDERRFPHDEVHRKLLQTISKELGETSQLYLLVRALLRERKVADYELVPLHNQTSALNVVDQAWDAIDAVLALTTNQITALANALHDIDRGI